MLPMLGWEVAEGQRTAAAIIRRKPKHQSVNLLARLTCDTAEAQQSKPQE